MPSIRHHRAMPWRVPSGSAERYLRARRNRTPRACRFELLEPRLALASNPLITEFMADNDSTLLDGDGVASDWIEIYNPTPQSINLAGWHLTDDAGNLDKSTFPAQPQSMLAPGEYLVVFASSKSIESYVDSAGYLHTDFALSADGEYLALTDPSQNIVQEFAPQFPRQLTDVSYGLSANTSSVTLVGPAQVAKALVPTNGLLDAPSAGVAPPWTLPSFDDSAWPTSGGGVGVGFDYGDDPFPDVPNGTLLPDGLIGHDHTDADDNGVLDGTIFGGGPSNWPNGEEPPRALDNAITTKWLAFDPVGASYGFRFLAGQQRVVNAYTITSANDAPSRDPYAWTLSGSNDGVNYTVIESRLAQAFANRFETRLYEFNNETAFEYYRFDFKTRFGVTGLEADRPNANAIQMAEIELLSVGSVDFTPLIDLDVEAAFLGARSSVYQRIEFDVSDPSAFTTLWLEIQYDDGFVAYLNGKRVAAARAPALPNFQSQATGERNDADTLVPELFNLTPYLTDLVAGNNVLSIHALNVNDGSPDLLSRPKLVATKLIDDTLIPVYMPHSTPGTPNSEGLFGIVDTPQLSAERGFYDAPFQLTIMTGTPDADIYYTTNGLPPTPEDGTLYTGPIVVSSTTTLRAQAYLAEYIPSIPVTDTYLFLDDIVRQNYQSTLNTGFPATWGSYTADYGMDPDVIGSFDQFGNSLGGDLFGGVYAATIKNDLLAIPTLSIVVDVDDMFGTNGIYTNGTLGGVAWERPASIELIYPDDAQGFQIDAGIRIHGGAFRRDDLSKKHSLRLLFKGIYEGNTKLNFPWFGEDAATSFDTIVLRMDSNDGYAWSSTGAKAQYARDEWGRRSQMALGQTASHGTRVHLYINGVYWGIYNPVERPDASFAASYYGGEKEEWDAINSGTTTDGTLAAWNTLVALSQAVSQASTEPARTAAYMKVLGLNADGTDNPNFETYLDAANYIDFLIVNYYGGNNDWPQRNWYAARRRGPESQGFVFHVWDYEWTLGLQSDVNTNRLNATDGAAVPYSSLRSSQEFRILFGDRVHRALFNNGALTSANSIARYQDIVQELEQAIVGESARWGDMHASTPYTKAHWQGEIPNVINFLTNRNSIFLQQLRSAGLYPTVDAPTFSQHGGQVPAGYDVTISAPAGTIWYTLDGSDPRTIGGGINPSAIQFNGTPVDIPATRTLRARVLAGGQWSALDEATFVVPANTVRITELHYNPAAFPGVADRQDIEFIELMNTGHETVNLTGFQIAGFDNDPYTFGTGLDLAAGQRIIVARNPTVFQFVYSPGYNVAPEGYSDRNLSNGGERVVLLGPLGEALQDFVYADASPWPTSPDGNGPSLEIINPLGDPTNPANWRASLYVGGSPGVSGVPGDYDGNSVVDGDDHLRWRGSFGLSVARGTGADGNRDSIVDAADYVVWRQNLGTQLAAANGASISAVSNNPVEPLERLPSDSAEFVDLALTELLLRPDNAPPASSRFLANPTAENILRVENSLLLAVRFGEEKIRNVSRTLDVDEAHSSDEVDRSDLDALLSELGVELLRRL